MSAVFTSVQVQGQSDQPPAIRVQPGASQLLPTVRIQDQTGLPPLQASEGSTQSPNGLQGP